jgi:hypothetical protein
MGLRWILMRLLRAQSGRDGMWDFLGKRAAARAEVDRELVDGQNRVGLAEVQNKGTQEMIRLLQGGGGTVREEGPDWSREIHMPAQPPSPDVSGATAVAPAISPSRAPQIEPPPGQAGGTAGESRA